jgi:triphosphatase
MSDDTMQIRLRLPPDSLARLRRPDTLARLADPAPAPPPAEAVRLRSVYWDTPDHVLARAGVVLRLRETGPERTQTVRNAGRGAAGLSTRREWVWPQTASTPDARRLGETGLSILRDAAVLARLTPLFTTELTRTRHLLDDGATAILLTLDNGTMGLGGGEEPVCEATLDLKRGDPAPLFVLARRIAASCPCHLLAMANAGHEAPPVAAAPPLPIKARPVAVADTMPVGAAFRAIGRNCLDQILGNERCLRATGNPEAIHQLRVALRRLRSAIRVFRDVVDGPDLAEIRAGIGWLLGPLGPARDDFVFLDEILHPVIAAHPDAKTLDALQGRWLAEHERHLAAARDAVAEPRFTALLLELAAWIESGSWLSRPETERRKRPLGPFAAKVLGKRHRKLTEATGPSLGALPPAELHRLRILGKQLRYAGEFFEPLWSGKATRFYLSTLAELQDLLGQLNDLTQAESRLSAGATEPGLAWAAGLVAGWHASRRPDLLDRADRAWHQFRHARPFWVPS